MILAGSTRQSPSISSAENTSALMVVLVYPSVVSDIVTSGREYQEDLRGIMPVTDERHGQCGRHVQRKHSGIHLN